MKNYVFGMIRWVIPYLWFLKRLQTSPNKGSRCQSGLKFCLEYFSTSLRDGYLGDDVGQLLGRFKWRNYELFKYVESFWSSSYLPPCLTVCATICPFVFRQFFFCLFSNWKSQAEQSFDFSSFLWAPSRLHFVSSPFLLRSSSRLSSFSHC